MNEIFDSKLDFGPIAENHTNPVRHPLPRCSREHLGIAAELNRVIRFRRERQFRVPGLIFTRRHRASGNRHIRQSRRRCKSSLINDRRLLLDCLQRRSVCDIEFVRRLLGFRLGRCPTLYSLFRTDCSCSSPVRERSFSSSVCSSGLISPTIFQIGNGPAMKQMATPDSESDRSANR